MCCSETPQQSPQCAEHLSPRPEDSLCYAQAAQLGRGQPWFQTLCISYSCPDFSRETAFSKAVACAVPDL